MCGHRKRIYDLESNYSTGDGTYWIDPAGENPFEAQCDMTTEGGGYTYYGVTSGIRTSKYTDNNSCIALGMDIVYPRSLLNWDSILARFSSSFFTTILGVYKASSGGSYTSCAMNFHKFCAVIGVSVMVETGGFDPQDIQNRMVMIQYIVGLVRVRSPLLLE